MYSLQYNLILVFASLFLVACGSNENSTASQNVDDGSVQLYGAKVATTASKLPACDSSQVGQLFYVLADQEFQFCSSEGYQSIDLSGIAGADGADGKDGANGTNGTNGSDGDDGADGSSCSVIGNANGSKTILCEDGTTATVSDGASCTVVDNDDGSYDLTCSGTTVTVRDGKDGKDGLNGTNGTDGINGVNGTNGTSCTAAQIAEGLQVSCGGTPVDTIVDGQDGVNGTNGTNGINGVNGTNGTSCTATQITEGLQVSCGGIPVDTIVDGQDGVNGTNGTNGVNGVNGTSISWLGTLYAKPASPTLNQAFYWKPAGVSCIWDGASWQLMTVDNGVTATTCSSEPGNIISGVLVDVRDFRNYKWVLIGNQRWMAENLAYLPSVNAKSEASASVAKYYVYNYDGTVVATAKASNYYTTYGVLYNWTAAMAGAATSTANPSGVKGVCPTGWHLPSSAEWTTLETYVGGASTAGTKLKSVSGWTSGGITGTDTFGFSALPGGFYFESGFGDALTGSFWWAATEYGAAGAYNRHMSFYDADVYSDNYDKILGFSVRCLLD